MQIRKKSQTSRCRWPLLLVVGPTLLIVLYMTVLHSILDNNNSSPSKQTQRTLRRDTLLSVSSHESSSVIRKGSSLPCHEVRQKVQSNVWPDPNHGRIYARETITEPHFRISLHNQEYDEIRWKTLMEEGKYYEDDVHKRFVEILQHYPPSYVVDVGANIGYYTLLSRALHHNVIAFEPNPGNIQRLCDSLRLNDFHDGVEILPNAVSNVHGEEMMLFAPKNPGQAFLKPIEGDTHTDEHQARTTLISLDKFAEEQGWFDRPEFEITLLKVDVEGKEPQVIMGAPKLLASGIVKNVLTEGRRFGRKNLFDSLVVLFEAGFTLKDPPVPKTGKTPEENAQGVVEYYKKKLGSDSMKCEDLWWVKE